MSLLEPPSLSAPLSMLADWMEIQAFSNIRKIATESDISAISHVDDELDDKEDSIETDANTEELVNEIFAEFERREKAAGSSYPFAINQSGTHLTVNATLNDAHYTYIFCLLVSEYRRRQILPKRVFEPIAAQVEDLFQICSTVAAAGLLSGCAISFGFPRSDGSAFLAALKRAYEDEVGEGQVVLKARPGVSSRTKDGGIDIIAWRHFPDKLPGKLHLLGQCASGNDYKGKSLKNYLATFHDDWFICVPASQTIEALFVPFMLEEGYAFIKGESKHETRHGHYLSMTRTMGMVVDRLRLAHLVELGMGIAKKDPSCVLVAADFQRVRDWVDTTEKTLTAATT